MFYATPISVTLWICGNHKKAKKVKRDDEEVVLRERKEVLFIDARKLGDGGNNEDGFVLLTDDDKIRIAKTLFSWQSPDWQNLYRNIPEFCYSATKEEIRQQDYSLAPSKYIQFIDHDFEIDYSAGIEQIQNNFAEILNESFAAQQELKEAFRGIGHGIN